MLYYVWWTFFITSMVAAVLAFLIIIVKSIKDKKKRRIFLTFFIPWVLLTIGLGIYDFVKGSHEPLDIVLMAPVIGLVLSLPVMAVIAIVQKLWPEKEPEKSKTTDKPASPAGRYK